MADTDIATSASTSSLTMPTLISRYLAGDSPADLAAECGISRIALRSRMIRFCLTADITYTDLVSHALASRVADADEELDSATDMLSIARAREKMRFFRMDFERRCPQLYGPKQEISTRKQVVIVVDRSCGGAVNTPNPEPSSPLDIAVPDEG